MVFKKPNLTRPLYDIFRVRATEMPDSVALLGPGQDSLTNVELLAQIHLVADVIGSFSNAGRVAVIMPNGPEMAVAMLGATASTVCAPFNPAFKRAELEFYFTDLGIGALFIDANLGGPAKDVAKSRGIRIIETYKTQKAGQFIVMQGKQPGATFIGPNDIALLLHTSGTTARPKIVPLLQRNLYASAVNIATTLKLGPSDRCLNVMPLSIFMGLLRLFWHPWLPAAPSSALAVSNPLTFFSWSTDSSLLGTLQCQPSIKRFSPRL